MQLLIKQRVFSWSASYDVYDEYGEAKYFVKAELFRLGHQLHVYDRYNNEIGMISQQLFKMLMTFDIELYGRYMGTIKQKWSFLRPKYEIQYKGWHVEGDFAGWNYNVVDGFNSVVHITKKLLTWGDTYVLDIANPEDELMGLLLVIAIDAANSSNNNNNYN